VELAMKDLSLRQLVACLGLAVILLAAMTPASGILLFAMVPLWFFVAFVFETPFRILLPAPLHAQPHSLLAVRASRAPPAR
jgi:hypothetical protein